MAEKVIRNNESIVPFLGERLSFIRGLDPLGLQNTSDATFSQLLPGLNNVTGRVRYYSFYCWLLDLYSKENGSTDPSEQQKFIRRAEFVIALASQYIDGDRSNIPGSLYANGQVEEKGIKKHNLQEGTFKPDGTTRGSYWTYPLGAFGQYYFGSLRSIGIINERENHAGLYIRINKKDDSIISGEELADAFDKNIGTTKKQLFLGALNSGFINEDELKSLLPDFNLTIISPDSEERELLTKLLIQKDYPLRIEEETSTLRKQTTKHLLQYLNTHSGDFTDRRFVYNCYDTHGSINSEKDECLMGWYYYQFNEFWHFSNTSILNGTLAYLDNVAGPKWMPMQQLVTDVAKGVIQLLIEKNYAESENDSVSTLLENISELDEYSCFEETSKNKLIEKGSNAFLLLLVLYIKNKNQLVELKEYSENNELAKDGEGSGYFITQFETHKQSNIFKFIYEYIYVNIIYRHQYVAFRKIRNGTQSTQKFIIEDMHIRYLGNFEATYTGPRVGNLFSFLSDLNIISKENSLTEEGKTLLNTLIEE